MTTSTEAVIWPVLIYGGIVLILVTGILLLSYLLGQRHSARRRNAPYESGIQPTSTDTPHFDAGYYMVGVFFILFDVEAAIIFTWAVASRELGWAGYIGASLFILTLLTGLVYVWKLGGLDWYSARTRRSGKDGL